MTASVFSLVFTCDICLTRAIMGSLPPGWAGPSHATDPKNKSPEHICDECAVCFGAWRDSRREARKAQAATKAKPKPKRKR